MIEKNEKDTHERAVVQVPGDGTQNNEEPCWML